MIGVADVPFEREKIVIELDGYATHSGRQAFERDRERQNRLMRAGYLVIRFTWRHLTTDPGYVVHTILEALSLRGLRGVRGVRGVGGVG